MVFEPEKELHRHVLCQRVEHPNKLMYKQKYLFNILS